MLVATVRALKMHGGGPPVAAGTPLDPAYRGEDVAMVAAGCANLVRHIENVRAWGLACVVAINRFATDTDAELAAVRSAALAAGAADAVVAEHHALGGRGAVALARAVAAACDAAGSPPPPLCFTYLLSDPAAAKIERLARGVFRAEGVDFAPAALAQLGALERHGFGLLPVCVAKTQYSFSADPAAKGAPAGFRLPVRGVRLAAGAGWLIVLVGDMPSIPGLPTRPCYYDIDLLPDGTVVGLS